MDTPTTGNVIIDGQDISNYKEKQLTQYRREDIGFVFQFYNLVQNLTALENVELATQICKDPKEPKTVLEQVGLQDRINNFPSQLSGGEQQRIAIARSLSYNPKIIIADEPTGNLDKDTENDILNIFEHLAKDENKCIIIVTHSQNVCDRADIVYELKK